MHIFGLILFVGIVSSTTKGQISIKQTTVVGFLPSELQSSIKLTTILETTTLSDKNNYQDCICTPFHKCKTYKAAPDGNELIDIRINAAPCQSYLDVCCNDTKILSNDKYDSSSPDTNDSDCGCVSPEDYSKEPHTDHIDITKKPYDGHNEEYTKKPYDGHKEDYTKEPYDSHKGDYTKEPHESHNEEYTKKPYDGHKEDYTKEPYDSHKGDYTKEPHESPNEEYTKKPYDSHKGEYTKEPYESHNEEYTKKPYEVPKEEYTKGPYDSHKGDYTKEPHESHNEEYTKKPYDSHKGEYTKEPYESHNEEYSKKPSYGQPGYVTKDPFVDTSYEVTEKSEKNQEQHKCGTWNKYGAGFRIGNAIDSESQFGEFPSMVAIFKEELSKDGEKKLVLHCGGSLIKKDVILTAAHCVIRKEISAMVVRAGEWDLKTEKEILNHQDRRVKKVVIHPDYYSGGLYNDVALIFTENPFSLQDNIQVICLPSKNDIIMYDTCYSSGWGKTVSYNNYTIVKNTDSGKAKEIGLYQVSILKKVELPIVPRDKCMDALRATRLGPKFVLHDSFICAGGQEGKDTCKGDGGSPLMCPYKDDPDHLVQVGIVAWGVSCGLADIPAAYVNVAGFAHWIKNEIENRGY